MDFLFDIGRVLLDFNFEAAMRPLVTQRDEATYARLMVAVEDRNDFECGQITADTFAQRCIQAANINATPQAFLHAWQNIFTPNLPMMRDVTRLAASPHHRIILFSNTNTTHWNWMRQHVPEMASIHGQILSFEIGAMKPSAEIYHAAIETYQLTPEHTGYIDDLPQNIETGRHLGFRCHTYRISHHQDFQAWLQSELTR